MVSIKAYSILLLTLLNLTQCPAFAHDLDPKFENPFQLRRDVAAYIENAKFTDAIAIQQKYLEKGNEQCRQMALFLRTAYFPKELPPPPGAEAILQQAVATQSLKEKIRLAGECVKTYPAFEFAHVALASAYSLNMEDSKAEKESLEAASIAPFNEMVLSQLGIVYIHRGQAKKARRVYERILKINPKNLDADAFFCEMNQKDGKLSNLMVFSRRDIKCLFDP